MLKLVIYPSIQVKQSHLIGSRQNWNYPDPISIRFREEMTREGRGHYSEEPRWDARQVGFSCWTLAPFLVSAS